MPRNQGDRIRREVDQFLAKGKVRSIEDMRHYHGGHAGSCGTSTCLAQAAREGQVVYRPTRSTRQAHASRAVAKTGALETRLPKAAAADTQKGVRAMKVFNAEVEKLLDRAGAKLDHELKGEPFDHRRFILETKAGPAFVTPYGNWVAVRFNDPEVAVKLVGSFQLNPYSGKWNHNYFGWALNEATRDVARWLEKIAA